MAVDILVECGLPRVQLGDRGGDSFVQQGEVLRKLREQLSPQRNVRLGSLQKRRGWAGFRDVEIEETIMKRLEGMHRLQKLQGVVHGIDQQRKLGKQPLPDNLLQILAHGDDLGPQNHLECIERL